MERGHIRDARLIVSAATEKPTRLKQTEKILIGATPGTEVLAEAGDCATREVSFLSDAHGSAPYKKELLRVYLRRAVQEALS